MARRDGVFVEPASAVGVAGMLQELERGESYAGATVVITVTGHGLKDTITPLEGVALPSTVIDADIEAAADVVHAPGGAIARLVHNCRSNPQLNAFASAILAASAASPPTSACAQ